MIDYPKYRPRDTFDASIKNTYILVDWSNLMYRSWFVASKRTWIAHCKFLDMIRVCVRKVKQPTSQIHLIFCGESPTPLKRKKIFKGYKGNRKHQDDDIFKGYKSSLVKCINSLGWGLVRAKGYEADDVIATLTKRIVTEDDMAEVIIFSGDRDLQQCLASPRVYIYRAPGIFLTPDLFLDEHGFGPEKYRVYKSLTGDRSDNISGVMGFGPVKATASIQAGTVAEDVWELGGAEASEQFRLAMDLVRLEDDLDIDISELHTGCPMLHEDRRDQFAKDFDKKLLFEIDRLREEMCHETV